MLAKKLWGVSLMAILYCVGAGAYLVLVLLAIGSRETLHSLLNGLSPQDSGPAQALLKLEPMLWAYFAVMAVVVAFLGYGMWALRNWARVVTLIITGVSLASTLVSVAQIADHINSTALGLSLFRVGLCLLVIWYLRRPDIRAAFRRPVIKERPNALIGGEIHE